MDQQAPQHGIKDNITIEGEGPPRVDNDAFVFGRMFPHAKAPPMSLKLSTCIALGARMTSQPEIGRANTDVPAGYTYFGQFIDHDITLDVTEERDREADNPATDGIEQTPDSDLQQSRSPSLDLDSVYGALTGARADLVGGFRFHIGSTTPFGGAGVGASGKSLPSDLPRLRDGKAIIGDARNDENLAVAQTHLLLLHFHNAVAEVIAEANPGMALSAVLEMARDLVTRHYQFIVLNDYLPRIIDADVHQDIIVNGNRKILSQGPSETAFMPLEFSVAGFRLGHSQVRETYEWNANFGTDSTQATGAPTPFQRLFQFSGLSGDLGSSASLRTLPSNWIADHRRMFDLSGHTFANLGGSVTGPMNVTRALDPYIAQVLGALPGMPAGMNNLAMLNLRRGGMRGLPSGQDISRLLPSVKMLSAAEMRSVLDPDFDVVMGNLDLYERTPLWLYILIEAAVRGKGNRLGPLGSTILAETFRTLVLTSRTSILAPRKPWTPDQAQATLGSAAPLDSIAELIAWTDQRFPVVDPIQDARNA